MIATSKWRRWRTSYGTLAGSVVGLVALADFLFYRRAVGWTAALFLAALVAGLLLRAGRGLRRPGGLLLLLATGGLAAALVEHPGVLPLLLAAVAVVTLALASRGVWESGVGRWVASIGRFIGGAPFRVVSDHRLAARWLGRHPPFAPWAGAPRLWLIPAALGGVFVALFAAANPIIARWVSAAWDALANVFDHLNALSDVPRLGLWLLTGACAWALLRAKARRKTRLARGPTFVPAPPGSRAGEPPG